jgi:hypothetical protein
MITLGYIFFCLKELVSIQLCEKILDFLNTLPYILPEILFCLPFLFGTTINRYLAKIARHRKRTEVVNFKRNKFSKWCIRKEDDMASLVNATPLAVLLWVVLGIAIF